MKLANLRVCASCEWIFKLSDSEDCPKCKFGSYGARYVYGNDCYKYQHSQKPWKDKKIENLELDLHIEILKTNPIEKKQPKKIQVWFNL